MNNKPKPEAIFYGVESMVMRRVNFRKEPKHAFLIIVHQVDYAMTLVVRDILISEEIGCRITPTMDREFTATKLTFTDDAKCVIRGQKIVVVPMLEE